MNFPILSTIIFIPFLGAAFIFLSSKREESKSGIYISLFTSIANLLLTFFLWYSFDKNSLGFQFVEEKNWISGLIKFKLGIDGISIVFSIEVLDTLQVPSSLEALILFILSSGLSFG